MGQSRKLFKFGFKKVVRDKNGKPVIDVNGREVKHLLVSDDPSQVAEFNATNCFHTKRTGGHDNRPSTARSS